MPTVTLPDDELAALRTAVRRLIEGDRFPRAPRLDPLRAALARLDAAATAEPVPLAKAKPAGKVDKRGRRSSGAPRSRRHPDILPDKPDR
jgi:hypothetical protein